MGRLYFTCSFDDGDIADLRLASLLAKYNLKGTFYIPKSCDLVSKSLSDSEIKELSASFEIGGHTLSHQVLTHIDTELAREEIYGCKTWLEDVTGKRISSFCPPTGRFSSEHVRMQEGAGFTNMRTVEMLSYSLKKVRREGNFVELPTTVQVYNHKSTAYLKNCIKRGNFTSYPLFRRCFDPRWDTMSRNYLARLNDVVKHGSETYCFHLWGHSWEIEKYGLWNSLEDFFKELTGLGNIIFCDNAELADYVRRN